MDPSVTTHAAERRWDSTLLPGRGIAKQHADYGGAGEGDHVDLHVEVEWHLDDLSQAVASDNALAKLPAGTVEYLLKPEKKEWLGNILAYHASKDKVLAADVKTLTAKTVNEKLAGIAQRAFLFVVSTVGGASMRGA